MEKLSFCNRYTQQKWQFTNYSSENRNINMEQTFYEEVPDQKPYLTIGCTLGIPLCCFQYTDANIFQASSSTGFNRRILLKTKYTSAATNISASNSVKFVRYLTKYIEAAEN